MTDVDWQKEAEKWEGECRSLEKKLEAAEIMAEKAKRTERYVLNMLVDTWAERQEAVYSNDVGQYRSDIERLTDRAYMLLDLLVKLNRPAALCGERK